MSYQFHWQPEATDIWSGQYRHGLTGQIDLLVDLFVISREDENISVKMHCRRRSSNIYVFTSRYPTATAFKEVEDMLLSEMYSPMEQLAHEISRSS